jgi:hypothetical protein
MATQHRSEHTLTFEASDDQGNIYTLLKYSHYVRITTSLGTSETEGFPEFKTDDSQDVNYMRGGNYQLVSNGRMLHTDDPEAQ